MYQLIDLGKELKFSTFILFRNLKLWQLHKVKFHLVVLNALQLHFLLIYNQLAHSTSLSDNVGRSWCQDMNCIDVLVWLTCTNHWHYGREFGLFYLPRSKSTAHLHCCCHCHSHRNLYESQHALIYSSTLLFFSFFGVQL